MCPFVQKPDYTFPQIQLLPGILRILRGKKNSLKEQVGKKMAALKPQKACDATTCHSACSALIRYETISGPQQGLTKWWFFRCVPWSPIRFWSDAFRSFKLLFAFLGLFLSSSCQGLLANQVIKVCLSHGEAGGVPNLRDWLIRWSFFLYYCQFRIQMFACKASTLRWSWMAEISSL